MTGSRIDARSAGLEGSVARLLRLGTYAAVALISAGVILMIAGGGSPLDVATPFDPVTLPARLLELRPEAVLWAGLLVVLVTPAARVALSIVGFARGGDTAMALVATLILVVVVAGVVAGTAGA